MKWNEGKYKFHVTDEATTWQTTKNPTTNLLNSIQKSMFVNLEVFQSSWSCSSSKRPTPHLPHLPPESRVLHYSSHTYQILWSRQRSVWVSHPHVLHELVIHPKHHKHLNFTGLETYVYVRDNQFDTRQDTLSKGLCIQDFQGNHSHLLFDLLYKT